MYLEISISLRINRNIIKIIIMMFRMALSGQKSLHVLNSHNEKLDDDLYKQHVTFVFKRYSTVLLSMIEHKSNVLLV